MFDDGHDEGSETLTLTLSNASGAYLEDGSAIGSINNSDPMPLAWMVRFGRTVGAQVVDALSERLESGGGAHVTIGGINLMGDAGEVPEENDDPFGLPDWATRDGLETDGDDITTDDLLLRSAFQLSNRTGDGTGTGPAFTAWGRVATNRFEATVDDVTMDGNVTTGLLGFDAEWERLLAGVMVSQSAGEGTYRLDPGERRGTVKSSLTGVYPYARLELNRQVSAWVLAGAGSGELTLHQDGEKAMPTDIGLRMGAVGMKGQVLDGTGANGLAVNVKSDAMWVGTKSERTSDMVATQGDVTRLRLIVEGERAFTLAVGGTFTPSAQLGLRHDGGDAETGTGVEVGAGLRYTIDSVTVEAEARTLVAHEDSAYKEWGASAAIRVTPDASGRGLTLSIAPAWRQTGAAHNGCGRHATPADSGRIPNSRRRAGSTSTQATGSGYATAAACSPPMRASRSAMAGHARCALGRAGSSPPTRCSGSRGRGAGTAPARARTKSGSERRFASERGMLDAVTLTHCWGHTGRPRGPARSPRPESAPGAPGHGAAHGGPDHRRGGDGESATDAERARRLRATCPKSIVDAATIPNHDHAPRESSGTPRHWLLPGTDRGALHLRQ